MNKIQLVSRILQYVFLFLLIALPVFSVIVWFYASIPNGYEVKTNFLSLTTNTIVHDLDFPGRLVGFLVNLIPLSIQMFGIFCLYKLFKLYEQGKIFTLLNVKYIRLVAITLIAQEIIRPFTQIITTYILTFNQPGHHMIAVTFSNKDISNILMGVVILLASWIMAEACKLHDEHTLTI